MSYSFKEQLENLAERMKERPSVSVPGSDHSPSATTMGTYSKEHLHLTVNINKRDEITNAIKNNRSEWSNLEVIQTKHRLAPSEDGSLKDNEVMLIVGSYKYNQ
jgi:hypothetical protein